MGSAGRNSISSCFQHGLQDGYLSLKPHVKGGLFPLNPADHIVTGYSALYLFHFNAPWKIDKPYSITVMSSKLFP